MIVRSISGLRFTLEELSTSIIHDYAIAFDKFLSSGSIVIGRDGRPSGQNIEELLVDIFTTLNRDVAVIGVVPTPTVQLYTETHGAAGAICITASHNPAEWNGLKFLSSKGLFLNEHENQHFWALLKEQASVFTMPEKNFVAQYTTKDSQDTSLQAINEHIDKILEIPFIKSEIPNIRNFLHEKRINFIVDAVNASGSRAVSLLLDRLYAQHIKLYCDETGIFPHNPEPISPNLQSICKKIKDLKNTSHNNYIGIAVDPDADRLALIDENGSYIGEELSVCLAIDSYLTLNPQCNNAVVVNQSTTQLVKDITTKHEKPLYHSAVGEINVVQKMQEVAAAIGGEGSGGIILPQCHYGRDSLVGIILFVSLLSKKNKLLHEYIANYSHYTMLKDKINNSASNNSTIYNMLAEKYKDEDISSVDGIKINFECGWVHVRVSNTEPIIRIISESKNESNAMKLMESIKNILVPA